MSRIYKPLRRLPDGKEWQSPKYYIEYTDAAGKKIRKPASTDRKEAKRLLQEAESRETRIRMGLELPRQEAPPLAQLRKTFLEAMEPRLRPRTYLDYKRDLRYLLDGTKRRKAWLPGVTRASDLTPTTIAGFQQAVLKEGLSPRSANRMLAALSALIHWSLRQGHLSQNPLVGSRLLPKGGKVDRKVLEEEEIDRLLAASSQDAKDCWTLLVDTGIRRQELVSLTVADIQDEQLYVRPSVDKSKRGRRVPLTKRALEVVNRRAAEKEAGDPIIEAIDGRVRVYDALAWALKSSLDRAEIEPEGIGCHTFRRTFITRLLSKGVAPHVVQRLAGHSTVNLTMEIYAQVRQHDFAEAVAKLE